LAQPLDEARRRPEIGGWCREKRIGGGRAVNVLEERRECKRSCREKRIVRDDE